MTVDDRSRGRVLIVEDEALVAETMREELEEAGFQVIGICNRLDRTFALLADVEFDVAIVDLNLAGVSAMPIVQHFTTVRQPFLVLSGYMREQLSDDLSQITFIRKPYLLEELVDALESLASGPLASEDS